MEFARLAGLLKCRPLIFGLVLRCVDFFRGNRSRVWGTLVGEGNLQLSVVVWAFKGP